MDRFTQYAIAASDQAVKDSEILGNVDPERFGVYVGSGTGGMETFLSCAKSYSLKVPKEYLHFYPYDDIQYCSRKYSHKI